MVVLGVPGVTHLIFGFDVRPVEFFRVLRHRTSESLDRDQSFDIVAERFVFSPSEVVVVEGTLVELRLTSEDTAHGFRLVGPGDIDVEIPKRGRGDVRVMFEASRPGEYRFECSRICGAGHDFMRGTIRVTPRPIVAGVTGGSLSEVAR
jgi:cytochrome c oxidase subunit 2